MQAGAPGVTRVSADTVFDPQRGFETRETWRGNINACNLLAAGFRAVGFRTSVEFTDGAGQVNVFIQLDVAPGAPPEMPIDRWEIDKDYFQASVWSNAQIQGQIAAFATLTGLSFDTLLAEMRRVLENAQNGRRLILASPSDPDMIELYRPATTGPLPPDTLVVRNNTYRQFFIDVYNLILRGGDFEAERVVTRRLRSFSVNFASRMVLDAVPKIYSPRAFYDTFGVPLVIQRQLPAEPAFTAPVSKWAWKLRRDGSVINWFGKVEEQREWVYADWSILEYDYVP